MALSSVLKKDMEKDMLLKNFVRWRRIFPALTWMLLGALFLNACGSMTGENRMPTGNGAQPTSRFTSTPMLSPTLRNQGATELQSFQQWVQLMQQNGGIVTTYQQQYAADQQALNEARTNAAYQAAIQTLQNHVQAIAIPAMKQEAQYLQQQLEQTVNTWSKQHPFNDTSNNTTYALGYQYDNVNGIGGPLWLGQELASDKTIADYQQTIEDLKMWLTNFQAMATNFNDQTPYSQPHQSDLDLLKHYHLMNEPVVIVSLNEEALRAYDKGKLVKAFLVTTGQPDLPSPPGVWWIEGKQHPTIFKSTEPQGSPHWYPPTPITYAMQYHSNGYFFHDAWWRTTFGPGTNFPHQDANGDPFAGQGSHGCINMSTSDAQWLYGFVSVYTHVILY